MDYYNNCVYVKDKRLFDTSDIGVTNLHFFLSHANPDRTDIKDRIGRLKEAKNVAQTINIIFCGAGLWAIFWPEPTIIIMWTMVILPFMVFTVMKYYKGLIKVSAKKETAYSVPQKLDNILRWKNLKLT